MSFELIYRLASSPNGSLGSATELSGLNSELGFNDSYQGFTISNMDGIGGLHSRYDSCYNIVMLSSLLDN